MALRHGHSRRDSLFSVLAVTGVKFTLVCVLLLGFVSLSPAQESSAWSGESVDVQRIFKFSGTLTETKRTRSVGAVNVHFTMYDQPDGGQAYWEETQSVRPDAQGRYTVLLGETTLGGLPQEIFASRGRHWLGVQAAGQAEQPRILLVELPSAWKPDPISLSAPVANKKTILPSDPTERHLAMILLIMFLVGTAMACVEVARWWKRRIEQFGQPPLADLFSSVPSPDELRSAAQVFGVPVYERLRSLRGRFLHSVKGIDVDQPKKAE